MADTREVPNPGSDEAIAAGCICAVMDNHRGRGYRGQHGVFIYTHGCPVHSPIAEAARTEREKQG